MMASAMAVRRGNGQRQPGGIYTEFCLSPDMLIESFLMDPPIPLSVELGVSPLGVTPIVQNGVTHLIDWVSAEHYENITDLLEETRAYGLTRPLPGSASILSRLTDKSRLLMVHARTIVENWYDYDTLHDRPCVTQRHTSADEQMCASLWWLDVTSGEAVPTAENPLQVRRYLPALSYTATRKPDGLVAEYLPGFFASFPIGRLVVVRSTNGEHITAYDRARTGALSVEIVDA